MTGLYRCDVDSAGDVRSFRRLECVECGRSHKTTSTVGRRGLTVEDEVAVYCPECDRREPARCLASGGGWLAIS